MKFDDVRLLVHEILDACPVFKQRIVVWFLGASSETVYDSAQHLTSRHS